MTCNKFIIGLDSNIPSTKVLKPPGGGCSDLFGLNSRQETLCKLFQTVINNKESSKMSKNSNVAVLDNHSDDAIKKVAENPWDVNVATNDFDVKTNLTSNVLNTPATDDVGIRTTTPPNIQGALQPNFNGLSNSVYSENHRHNTELEINVRDSADRKGNSTNEERLSVKSVLHSPARSVRSVKSSLKSSPSLSVKSVRSVLSNASTSKSSSRVSELLNSNDSLSDTSDSTDLRKENRIEKASTSSNETKYVTRSFIRNPITGEVTEVTGKNYSKSTGVTVIDFEADGKASSNVMLGDIIQSKKKHVRRNPITGEGTEFDPCCAESGKNFVRSGVRIKQPPGGISSGIF